MAIAITWPNIFKLTSLVVVLASLFITAGSTIVGWQLDTVSRRLDERLSIYQVQQKEIREDIDRINDRLLRVERR